jgi:signal transduction histidine kinase
MEKQNMEKKLQIQKTMMILYIISAVIAFTYSLSFMTAYKDLFGLMLKDNANIAYFHDVFMQGFNQTMFWFTLFGVASIAFFFIFGTRIYAPDLFAVLFISVSLLIVCGFCIYAFIELPSLKQTYLSLDFSKMYLEGSVDYKVKTGTFIVGIVVFAFDLIIALLTVGSQFLSFFGYKKLHKETA